MVLEEWTHVDRVMNHMTELINDLSTVEICQYKVFDQEWQETKQRFEDIAKKSRNYAEVYLYHRR